MSSSPKVSVIVPVYNAGGHLQECLESMINQSMQDIEIICVDDGSTDNSADILKAYALKDKRITVIWQQNMNAGVARNAGIAAARGKYIGFVDSDDYVASDMYARLYAKAEADALDICVCAYTGFDASSKKLLYTYGVKEKFIKHFHQPKPGVIHLRPQDPIFQLTTPTPWNKIFSKRLLSENHISFQSIKSSNDIAFTNTALACARQIGFITEPLYFYRFNTKNSLTSTKDTNIYSFYEAIKELHRRLEKRGKLEMFHRSFINAIVAYCFFNLKKTSPENRGAVKELIIKKIFPQYNISWKTLPQIYSADYMLKICKFFLFSRFRIY